MRPVGPVEFEDSPGIGRHQKAIKCFGSRIAGGGFPGARIDTESESVRSTLPFLPSEYGRWFRAHLASRTHGIASRTERYTSVDSRATLGLRFD
jgi:hypothetical protein